jgi:hypothetical protein
VNDPDLLDRREGEGNGQCVGSVVLELDIAQDIEAGNEGAPPILGFVYQRFARDMTGSGPAYSVLRVLSQ